MKTLILLAHPGIDDRSIANKIIIERVKPLESVTVKDLYGEYPTFKFDVDAEQRALVEAESIVFQFPFYWYSVPGILKEWLDQVFTYGFAYGSEGKKLKGKQFLISATIGGPEDAYCEAGYNNHTIDDLLKPLRQTAHLAGMHYNTPVTSHDMIYIPDVYNKREEVEERAREHAEQLYDYIAQG